MAIYLTLDNNGNTTEATGVATSTGAPDSGKLVQLDATGKIDVSQMPNGVAADAVTVVASEALAAGAFVNIYNDSGTLKARNAIATGIGMQAHGYTNTAVLNGGSATIFFDEANTGVTGLTPGTGYFLSATVAGGTASAPPTGTGKIVQKVGVAAGATSIHVKLSDPVIRA